VSSSRLIPALHPPVIATPPDALGVPFSNSQRTLQMMEANNLTISLTSTGSPKVILFKPTGVTRSFAPHPVVLARMLILPAIILTTVAPTPPIRPLETVEPVGLVSKSLSVHEISSVKLYKLFYGNVVTTISFTKLR